MSDKDLWAVIGRAKVDGAFASHLRRDFARAVQESGYSLEPGELELAKAGVGAAPAAPAPASRAAAPQQFSGFGEPELQRLRSAQVERMTELGKFTVDILKKTLNNAARTYYLVTWMNGIMFCMGVALFLFAAGYGAVSRNLQFTAAFAGLGAASFVTMFILGPIKKTQAALSNLIQAEVAFMNYFEQITFLENFAQMPSPSTGTPCTENIERASELLQKRSQETIQMLQAYLEDDEAKENDASKKT